MHAQKIRYDDSFIADGEQKKSSNTGNFASLAAPSANHVPSPARQLQQQLEEQYSDTVTAKSVEKYSALTSLSIIIGSCLFLWTGMIALGLFIYR
ncbi:MAG: hypothetical protein ABJP02_12930 [Parasphingorhabdus sp.]|uniref:hypothetical protein n=1 Tax=Parasphingorhabdus sp. TaxID=2709688 RepID=UPI003296CC8A